jgi:hypothetical protein
LPRPAAAQGAAWLARPPPRALVLALPKELLDEERRGDRGAAGGPAAPAPPAEDAAARDEEARLFQALVALRKARPVLPGSGVGLLRGAARCVQAPARAARVLPGRALLLPALPQMQAPSVGLSGIRTAHCGVGKWRRACRGCQGNSGRDRAGARGGGGRRHGADACGRRRAAVGAGT